VTKDGRVKILDFGLAKLTRPQADSDAPGPTATHATEPGVVMGTAGYMSPEQVRGRTVDHRADIFAFGAILYEMLAGKRAFHRSTSADTMAAILNEDPPGISQIVQSTPPGLQRVVHRCLEKSPEQRFQSASDLAFALEALSESGSASGAGTPAPPSRRWPRRTLALSTGLASLLALTAVAYYFVTRIQKVPFVHYSIQRVMDSEHVAMTAISPDGNYLAAVVNDANGEESLLLHHIPTGSERAIIQDPNHKYGDLAFSPDGSYIYFEIDALGTPAPDRADEYRIPVLGGQPSRIIEDIGAPLSFIDGGRRVCFYREDRTAGTYRFINAGVDGSDEQVLANGKKPFPNSSACAPDGRTIVFQDKLALQSIAVTSGTRQVISSQPALTSFTELHWAPNGKGLFAVSFLTQRGQLSFLSYPGSNLHSITNDLSNYSGISLTADARTIAVTQRHSNQRFGQLSLADPTQMQEHQTGGLIWFACVNSNTIAESDIENGLRVFDLTKSNTSSIGTGAGKGRLFFHPVLCGSNTLVASSWGPDRKTSSIYRVPLDGSGSIQLTEGPTDFLPECTANGKWLFYADNRDEHDAKLKRQPLQGGSPRTIVGSTSVWFDLSLDGKLLATVNRVATHDELRIYSTDSLQAIRSFPSPRGMEEWGVAFSADSKSVFYPTKTGSDTTIWRQSLASASPVKVATLIGKSVKWCRPSPDGTKLGLVISTSTSEAVLLRDVQ